MMFGDTFTMDEFSTKQGQLFYSFPIYEEENGLITMEELKERLLPHIRGGEGKN